MNGKRLAALCVAGLMASSVLTGCGANATVATTDTGVKVEYSLVNFMCRYQQAYMADLYAAYYGITDFEAEITGGTTAGESIKENVVDTLHDMLAIEQHASEVGVALTTDEQQAIKAAATQFMADNDKKTLKELGASQETVERYLTLMTIRAKAYNTIIAGADTNVSDAEANMSKYTVLSIETDGYIDYNTYQYVAYTEEESAKRAQDAKDIFAAIDDAANFESVAETYGYTASVNYYDQANTSLDEAVKTALDGLKEGELSSLIEVENTYYIVRLDARTDVEKTEGNRQSIIENRQTTLYNDTLDGWKENDGWKVKENALKKINFKDTFTLVEETEASAEEAGTEQ